MKIKCLTCLLLLAGHYSCNKINDTSSNYTIALKNRINTKEYFSFNNLVNDISVIELKQSKGSFISTARKIHITKDCHILLLNGTTGIYDYDQQGNLQKIIGKIGKGPGEYLEAKDFCLSIDESIIHVLSLHKINSYSRKDGKFLRSINITPYRKDGYLPEYFTNDGSNGFFLWDSNPPKETDFSKPFFCLWHINNNGKVLEKSFERTEFVFELPRFTKSFDGSFWIRPLEGSSFLFKLSQDILIKEVFIDFDDQYIPKSYFSQYNGSPYQFLDKWINSDYYKLPCNFYDDSRHLLFTFGGPNGITYNCLYNKKDGSIIAGRKNINNPGISYADSTYFYAYYDPSSSDTDKMDSIFRVMILDQVSYDKSFLFKFKLNEN